MSLLSALIPPLNRTATPDQAPGISPIIKPVHTLTDTADGFALTVYLPGVTHAGLELHADAKTLTVIGRRAWKQPENWTALHRESEDAPYELVLSHDNLVDPDKIQAELRDGVLRVALSKPESVKPRKITVN